MMTKETAAKLFLELGAVVFRPADPFVCESGWIAPVHADCGVITLHPGARSEVAAALAHEARGAGPGAEIAVAAGPSAVPFAHDVSRRLGLPLAYVRKERKSYGMGKRIEGASVEGRRVLLIAETIAAGVEIPASIEAIREAGGTVAYCQALIDLELGVNDRTLAENAVASGSLTRLQDVMRIAELELRLSGEDRRAIEEWAASPNDWDARRRVRLEASLNEHKRIVAETLFRTQAVRIRVAPPFRYSGGGSGPIYTDNRVLLAFPEEREKVEAAMAEMLVRRIGLGAIDCIGAIATAGIPFAGGLTDIVGLPMVIVGAGVEEQRLELGLPRLLNPGARVLLIEDLVNKGTSTLAAAKAVRDAGARVVACMSVFNYGLKETTERFVANDLILHSASDLESLLAVGAAAGAITGDDVEVVRSWADDPAGWAERRPAP